MKKIMIALAAVAYAVSAQAASVSWKMGSGVKPDGSSNAASGTLNMYVWVVDQATYNGTSVDSIWETYGDKTIASITGYSTSVTGKGGATGGTASYTVEIPASDKTYYGIVLTTYDSDKDGIVDMYSANKVETMINSAGTASGGLNSAKGVWVNAPSPTPPIPEPTSGLLLVLGMAGLALRRKQA